MEENFSEYTDTDLTRAWNHLETCVLSDYIEKRMDSIMRECQSRGILAWDKDGNITEQKN